ncbi:MAG: stage 0 sporulation family protein, partial [Phycisphaerae bacterium]
EHLFGGERIIFYFVADGRVDFRGLVRDLAREYQTRIEMRQIGARDEARLIADYEICGRQCCCKNFLKSLRPVSMKMAKIQKATLDPSKVSGRCGRLRCCLRYEQQTYEELEAALPRAGCVVRTGYGCGTVIDRQVLTQLVQVRLEDGRLLSIPVEELLEAEPPDEAAGKRATGAGGTLQGPGQEPRDGPGRSDQTSQPGGRRGRGKRDGPGAAGS